MFLLSRRYIAIFLPIFVLLVKFVELQVNLNNCNGNGVDENGFCNCYKKFGGPTCNLTCTDISTDPNFVESNFNFDGISAFNNYPLYNPSRKELYYTMSQKLDEDLETRVVIRPLDQTISATSFNSSSPCTLWPNNRTTIFNCVYGSSLSNLNITQCFLRNVTESLISYSGLVTFWTRKLKKIQPVEPGEPIDEYINHYTSFLMQYNLPKELAVSSTFQYVVDPLSLPFQLYFTSITEEFAVTADGGRVTALVIYKTRTRTPFIVGQVAGTFDAAGTSQSVTSFKEIATRATETLSGLTYYVQYWEMKANFKLECSNSMLNKNFTYSLQINNCATGSTVLDPYCASSPFSNVTVTHLIKSSSACAGVIYVNANPSGAMSFHGSPNFDTPKSSYSSLERVYAKITSTVKSADGYNTIFKIKATTLVSLTAKGEQVTLAPGQTVTPSYTLYAGDVTTVGSAAKMKLHPLNNGQLGVSFEAQTLFGLTNVGTYILEGKVLIDYEDKPMARSFQRLVNFRIINNEARAASSKLQADAMTSGKFQILTVRPSAGSRPSVSKLLCFALAFAMYCLLKKN